MIVVADIHLGKVQDTIPKNGYPSRPYDAVQRLKESVEKASVLGETLVLAGDVFDSTTPSPWMIDLLFEVIDHAEAKGVPVFLTPKHAARAIAALIRYRLHLIKSRKLKVAS